VTGAGAERDGAAAPSVAERDALLTTLRERFARHAGRHPMMAWDEVEGRLASDPGKLAALQAMERTGGEPDAVGRDEATGAVVFVDCAPESPSGRRSLCYDGRALEARRENKPRGSAADLAAAMGAEILTEAQYRALQALGAFDQKTSSWIWTPEPIRARGGALFCDRRYDTVFVYHNGAESYYASRGFRARLLV
jgi:hypothetical protein